jgi:predicted GIY-YIG superfamily endonuclease
MIGMPLQSVYLIERNRTYYCGLTLRAKEVRTWASTKGTKIVSKGTNVKYLVYKQMNSDGKGHVYD